jgi:hypothetical protein
MPAFELPQPGSLADAQNILAQYGSEAWIMAGGLDLDITRLNALRPGDLLTAIRLPSTWAGAEFCFEKVRDRNVWDFPMLNVASAMAVGGHHPAHPSLGERRRRASPSAKGGRRRGARKAPQCGNRRDGRKTGRGGGRSLAVQCLQNPADAKSGQAGDQWSPRGNMGIVEWATSPWGQKIPIHIGFFLI